MTARPAQGYAFANWTANGTIVSTSPTLTVTVDADLALTANFTPAGS